MSGGTSWSRKSAVEGTPVALRSSGSNFRGGRRTKGRRGPVAGRLLGGGTELLRQPSGGRLDSLSKSLGELVEVGHHVPSTTWARSSGDIASSPSAVIALGASSTSPGCTDEGARHAYIELCNQVFNQVKNDEEGSGDRRGQT
jgi:hypothetical protein